ncbi:MAG: fused MFS/spermidine synthase [Bacillota bacterium]
MTGLFLEAVVFLAGAVFMAVEVVGSRVLAPDFGSSVFTWGSLIGVFLAALSVGYYLGGEAADRLPGEPLLYAALGGAGGLTMLVPAVAPALTKAVLAADLGPRIGPLAAAAVLFAIPAVLLGMVSPLAIKLRAASLSGLGRTAGRLYALSTAGSIAGTFAASFWLIPAFGTRPILTGLGLVLTGLSAAGFGLQRQWRLAATPLGVAVVVIALLPGQPLPATSMVLVHEEESHYHRILVVEDGHSRWLKFDNSWQSGMSLTDPFDTPTVYTGYFRLPMLVTPHARRVLFVGLGGGSAPKDFWRRYPRVAVDAVELDPAVVRVAREYFALPEDSRLRVVVEDGRAFLTKPGDEYDLIVLDAYYADAIPFHLTTVEFWRIAAGRLAPGGIVAVNIIGCLAGEPGGLFAAMYKTMGEVFADRAAYGVGLGPASPATVRRNIIVFARGTGAQRLAPAIAVAALRASPEYGELVATHYAAPEVGAAAAVLTDDHAPVDALLHLYKPRRP